MEHIPGYDNWKTTPPEEVENVCDSDEELEEE